MSALDADLWAFLATDILLLEAESRLPAPPQAPVFARETVRPSKGGAS